MQIYKTYYPCGEIYIPSFYRIPRPLFYHSDFDKLSNNAKLLYTLLLDRLSLSMANSWYDEKYRVFVYFTVYDVTTHLNCSRSTALQLFRELTDAGLIERVRQGLGKPDMIYVNLLEGMDLLPPKDD